MELSWDLAEIMHFAQLPDMQAGVTGEQTEAVRRKMQTNSILWTVFYVPLGAYGKSAYIKRLR